MRQVVLELSRVQKNESITIEKIFLILITIFAGVTFVIQPIFSVPDEGAHFTNAYSVFHRETNSKDLMTYRYPIDSKMYRSFKIIDMYTKKGDYTQDKITWHLNRGNFQYLPPAIGMLIGQLIYPSTGVILSFGRLFNLLFYIIAIYFAIKKAKFGKWMMAAVALLPMSLQQAASVSYDVFFYATIFFGFSLMTNLVTYHGLLKRKDYLPIVLVICSFFLAKQSSLAMLLYFFALPVSLLIPNFFSNTIDVIWKFFNRHRIVFTAVMLTLFVLFLQFYFRNFGGLTRGLQVLFNSYFRPDIKQDLDSILVTGIVGIFGVFTHRFPEWFVILDFIFLFLILLNEKPIRLQNRFVFTSSMVFLGNIIMVSLTMYTVWTVGVLKQVDNLFSSGEQGRYFTPFLICLVPLGIYLKKFIAIKLSDVVFKRLFIGVMVINFIYFVVLTLLFYYSNDRGVQFIIKFYTWMRGLV